MNPEDKLKEIAGVFDPVAAKEKRKKDKLHRIDSWKSVMHSLLLLKHEEQITDATYEYLSDCMMDLKEFCDD